jgi:hypothetical protein
MNGRVALDYARRRSGVVGPKRDGNHCLGEPLVISRGRDDRRITGQVLPPRRVNPVRSGNPSGEDPPEWMASDPNNSTRMAPGVEPGPARSPERRRCGSIARYWGNSREQIPRIRHPRSPFPHIYRKLLIQRTCGKAAFRIQTRKLTPISQLPKGFASRNPREMCGRSARSIPGNTRSPYHFLLLAGDVTNTAPAIRACVLSNHGEPPANCPPDTVTYSVVCTEIRGRQPICTIDMAGVRG